LRGVPSEEKQVVNIVQKLFPATGRFATKIFATGKTLPTTKMIATKTKYLPPPRYLPPSKDLPPPKDLPPSPTIMIDNLGSRHHLHCYVIVRISLAFVSGPSSFCRNVKVTVKKLSHNQSNVKY